MCENDVIEVQSYTIFCGVSFNLQERRLNLVDKKKMQFFSFRVTVPRQPSIRTVEWCVYMTLFTSYAYIFIIYSNKEISVKIKQTSKYQNLFEKYRDKGGYIIDLILLEKQKYFGNTIQRIAI